MACCISGDPNPDFSKGIKDEHCVMFGCELDFTTSNYGLTTSPKREYEISTHTGMRRCAEKDMLDKKGRPVRVIRRIEELRLLKVSKKAHLTDDEILAVVRSPPIPIRENCSDKPRSPAL